MTVLYFTASGNCLYVARCIGGTLLSIPQLMRQAHIEPITDEAIGIVCPVYAAEMPMMVRAFLERAQIHTPYFFFAYTYGMGYGEAFAHAALSAEAAGLHLSLSLPFKWWITISPSSICTSRRPHCRKKTWRVRLRACVKISLPDARLQSRSPLRHGQIC